MAVQEKLFEKFPPITTQDWLDRITTDLKGADFNKRMVWKTNEGFDVKPFYRSEDTKGLRSTDSMPGEFPYLRGNKKTNNSWFIRQNISVRDYSEANKKALRLLMLGVDSLGFMIEDPETVNHQNFEILLNELHPESIEINFQCNGKALEMHSILQDYLKKRGIEANKLTGTLEVFPLGRLMLNGKLCIEIEDGLDYLARLVKQSSSLPNLRVVLVDASDFANAGADVTTELAFGLSMGNEYLASLADRDIDPAFAASKMKFTFCTGSDYFIEIAKLRAARLLWSVITDRYKSTSDGSALMIIHSVTSRWNKTLYDPFVNLLRTQTEAMSAILGGTDSLTVEAFDVIYKSPDEFSERIARNQQLLLKEEVHFDKIADAAAGSYYIENLTALITEKAWEKFIEIEEKGGFVKALKDGFIQQKIKDISKKRKKDAATRKATFVGTNQYPNLSEKISEEIDISKLMHNISDSENLVVEPVLYTRGAEEIEMLRIAVDNSGKRPVVFLFTSGNPVMKKARAQFSTSFFGCAGYRIIENNDTATFDEGVRAAIECKAAIVVVCSSDEEYAELAPAVYEKLKDKAMIVVAGAPADIEILKTKGLEYFISLRSDLHETLQMFNKKLGIQ